MKKHIVLIGLVMIGVFSSCKKLIEVDASTTLVLGSEVYKDSSTVQAAVTGMYSKLAFNSYLVSLTTLCGFSADELSYVGTGFDPYINNALQSDDASVANIWSALYGDIYVANTIIENMATATGISERFRNQATAEARFIRAFCYFYLTNLFGDVPLMVTTDVAANAKAPRTAAASVYNQMKADLLFAQSTLAPDYSVSGNARTRANKWVATALLAKVYLYKGEWANAEAQSTAIINNTALYGMPNDLTKVFTTTSTEAIWQLYNDANGFTALAGVVLPNPVSQVPTYVLRPQLVNAFEPGDQRRVRWTTDLIYNGTVYTYPSKYKSNKTGENTEYFTVFRLAEQYLVRAEARAQQDNFKDAGSDLSAVRQRAGLGIITVADRGTALAAVEQERRVELNVEWGSRWFDLKRTNRADAVLGALKPTTWKSTAVLYPVPSGQITINSNLLPNNLGYN
jgi:hypothetical protein